METPKQDERQRIRTTRGDVRLEGPRIWKLQNRMSVSESGLPEDRILVGVEVGDLGDRRALGGLEVGALGVGHG